MESGLPFGDIIVLGAIAAFIILRYRAMLGENRGRDIEDKRKNANDNQEMAEKVIQLPRKNRRKEEEQAPQKTYTPEIAAGFTAIKAHDTQFEEDAFLEGAKIAFEMVITAFNERDKKTLEMLLDNDTYHSFADAIDTQNTQKKYNQTTLVSIDKAEIIRASMEDHLAKIEVAFTSEQIHLIKDEKGTIIEGDVSEQKLIEDSWCFARDTRSSKPDWKIIET